MESSSLPPTHKSHLWKILLLLFLICVIALLTPFLKKTLSCLTPQLSTLSPSPDSSSSPMPLRDYAVIDNGPIPNPETFYRTSYKTECEFGATKVITEIAQMLDYAAQKQNSRPDQIKIFVREKKSEPQKETLSQNQLLMNVEIEVQGKKETLDLDISQGLWDPETYQPVIPKIAQLIGVTLQDENIKDARKDILQPLLNFSAQELMSANEIVSGELEKSMLDARTHERAAFILGVAGLREMSGKFYEIKTFLNAMTAHRALARALKKEKDQAPQEALLSTILEETLLNNQINAMKLIDALPDDSTSSMWKEGLKAYITCDGRPLKSSLSAYKSRFGDLMLFRATAKSVSTEMAIKEVSDELANSGPEVLRILADEGAYGSISVQTGHIILNYLMKAEFQECDAYLSIPNVVGADSTFVLVKILNTLPTETVRQADGKIKIEVLNEGLRAWQMQRHLCNAMWVNYDFMQNRWGVPDDAKEFSSSMIKNFGDLTLFPLLEWLFEVDELKCRKDLQELVRNMPGITPLSAWVFLGNPQPSKNSYMSPEGLPPHYDEWILHNPPPSCHNELIMRSQKSNYINATLRSPSFVKQLNETPYDYNFLLFYLSKKIDQENADDARKLLAPVLDYNSKALSYLGGKITNPEEQEKIFLKAAEMNPTYYTSLGMMQRNLDRDENAAKYFEKYIESHIDDVGGANLTKWLVLYYISQPDPDKEHLKKLGTFGGEVYSGRGLYAQALAQEYLGEYDNAFTTFLKIVERYGPDSKYAAGLVAFNQRRIEKADKSFDLRTENYTKEIFPNGIEKWDPKDTSEDGVVITSTYKKGQQRGFLAQDIIMAVNGIRVHNMAQYLSASFFTLSPQVNFVVKRNNNIVDISCRSLDRDIEVDMQSTSRE